MDVSDKMPLQEVRASHMHLPLIEGNTCVESLNKKMVQGVLAWDLPSHPHSLPFLQPMSSSDI